MKAALEKSPIPSTLTYVAKLLKEPNFDPNWHFHTEYQLFMVLKGSGTRFIGDHIKHFNKGDITFTGPNLPHLWRSDQKDSDGGPEMYTEGIVVYFDEDLIGKHLLQKEEMIRLKQLLHNSKRGIEIFGETGNTIKKMLLDLVPMEGLEGFIALLQILNCLAKSAEYRLLASPGYTNTLRETDTKRMGIAHTFILQNFKRKITLSEVAGLAHMTPSSFSRYFRNHANKTFSDFLSELRIGYACKLLIEQKMNSTQACYESGFHTLSNFNKQFKSITNRTPGEYKREYDAK